MSTPEIQVFFSSPLLFLYWQDFNKHVHIHSLSPFVDWGKDPHQLPKENFSLTDLMRQRIQCSAKGCLNFSIRLPPNWSQPPTLTSIPYSLHSASGVIYSRGKHHTPPVHGFPTVQFSSVAQSCPTLCDPVNHSTPGLPVHHQLLEFTQTHVHWVGDAIQPSHPLSSPSPPALNLSQHQGLFQWVSSSHQVAKVLEFQLQPQSFQWIFRTDLL